MFKLSANFSPNGDQPRAIEALTNGIINDKKSQALLGVTGSGKTFTMANVIQNVNKPTLIMAHNKTLAAQLYNEMKDFFPNNAVEYFVSYYDYYQPEAYIPNSDTYIEKDAQINEKIDLLRHSATRALLERRDVIVISSVSCIYGLGAPELYLKMSFELKKGEQKNRELILKQLVDLQYSRNDTAFDRGNFRVKGDILDIFPSHMEDKAWRLSFFGNEIERINEFDPLTGARINDFDSIRIFANSHYVTPKSVITKSIKLIKQELKERLQWYADNNMLLEAQRLEQRTNFDLEMLLETGNCKGIENYSRYLSGRKAGQAPPTLFEYLPKDSLLIVDESHVTTPQIAGMYNGDRARKSNLVNYGFRLPSALDNRPLKYEEWDEMRPQTIFVSATPAEKELSYCDGKYVEQIIRPTGLLDPICDIKPATNQVDDLLEECRKAVTEQKRVLVTTLTKKMAEDLTEYLSEIGIATVYLHSDVKTLERIEVIRDLRLGVYNVLVGVNLLREGLDIPECGLIAILDADKEGFLRSETSLIQTIGRAARNSEGRVILYANKKTKSIKAAVTETERRRKLQHEYNQQHNITPQTITKKIEDLWNFDGIQSKKAKSKRDDLVMGKILKMNNKQREELITKMKKEMLTAAENLDFEAAASIRDKIQAIENKMLN